MGCVLVQHERRWDGCALGCWGAGGDMAHHPLCGTGTWVQAQQFFFFFGMASAVPASYEHPPSHSICNADSRDRDLITGQFIVLSLDSMPCKVRLPHLLQAMNWHALQIWPSFTHSRYKIYRFRLHLCGIASLCQCHNRLVTL